MFTIATFVHAASHSRVDSFARGDSFCRSPNSNDGIIETPWFIRGLNQALAHSAIRWAIASRVGGAIYIFLAWSHGSLNVSRLRRFIASPIASFVDSLVYLRIHSVDHVVRRRLSIDAVQYFSAPPRILFRAWKFGLAN